MDVSALFWFCAFSLFVANDLAPIDERDDHRLDTSTIRRAKRAVVEMDLSEYDIAMWHNYYRRKPMASNMEYVKYNQVLADKALWWAKKCRFDYAPPEEQQYSGDTARTTLSPLVTDYGQNIYHVSETMLNNDLLESGLSSWYDEMRVYIAENDTCLINSCRHYKQLMWSSVQRVGCAASRCDRLRTPAGENYANRVFLVCNYDVQQTTGSPYQTGFQCSNCSVQDEAAKCDDGLCRRDGKGVIISLSDNLILDPTARPTTKKPRAPTIPPEILRMIEAAFPGRPQYPNPVGNLPVVRSSIAPALTARPPPSSNTPSPRSTYRPAAPVGRSSIPDSGRTEQPAAVSRTAEVWIRSTPAPIARTTANPMARTTERWKTTVINPRNTVA